MLLLHGTMSADDVVAVIRAALTVGAVTADVVAVEAHRHAAGGEPRFERAQTEPTRGTGQQAVSLTQRRLADPAAVIAGLPVDTRPLPSVDAYDQLLRLPDRNPLNQAEPAQEGTAS